MCLVVLRRLKGLKSVMASKIKVSLEGVFFIFADALLKRSALELGVEMHFYRHRAQKSECIFTAFTKFEDHCPAGPSLEGLKVAPVSHRSR